MKMTLDLKCQWWYGVQSAKTNWLNLKSIFINRTATIARYSQSMIQTRHHPMVNTIWFMLNCAHQHIFYAFFCTEESFQGKKHRFQDWNVHRSVHLWPFWNANMNHVIIFLWSYLKNQVFWIGYHMLRNSEMPL